MRIIIFLFLAMFISIGAFSKDRKPSYFETYDPSPDSLMTGFNLETDGGVYTIVGVDSVSGLSAEQLFTKAKSWIGQIYNSSFGSESTLCRGGPCGRPQPME